MIDAEHYLIILSKSLFNKKEYTTTGNYCEIKVRLTDEMGCLTKQVLSNPKDY